MSVSPDNHDDAGSVLRLDSDRDGRGGSVEPPTVIAGH